MNNRRVNAKLSSRFPLYILLTISAIGVLLFGADILMTSKGMASTIHEKHINYDDELARIEQELDAKVKISHLKPTSWLHLEAVANAYLQRARLTGAFSDYMAAKSYINKAFNLAGENSGPYLTRAKINYSIHRLPDIEADLVKAESALLIDNSTLATIKGIRADVLFHTANALQAKSELEQLDRSSPDVTSATRLAHYYVYTANFNEADRWLEVAETRVDGTSHHLRSWLKLQKGIVDLEQGELEKALVHYEEGITLFPGYWLIEEHIAEIHALQGHYQKAEDAYRELIARTNSPLFMSALADVLSFSDVASDQAEAREWQAKASHVYELQSNQMPELLSGHALDHFLDNGEFDRAIELAKFDAELRPGGGNTLRLAQAYAAIGNVSYAMQLLDKLMASPYRSAELFSTAGAVPSCSRYMQSG